MKIWWINPADCKAIGENLPENFPEYMRREYGRCDSIKNKGCNGILFVEPEIELKKGHRIQVFPWPYETPLGKVLTNYSGIVIENEDVALVQALPGVLTDFKLNRLDMQLHDSGWGLLKDLK
mgnify:CR=1 FL=1